MKKMTLQEIQKVSLEIMQDVHEFCIRNNIKYTLAYGSLLGAVRHKGFIPWDDDIDIWMPRVDYERFSKEYKSNKGYRMLSVYDDRLYLNYTIVYDDSTFVERPSQAASCETGVNIDVFPIDGVSDDLTIRKENYQKLCRYMKLMFLYRRFKGKTAQNGWANKKEAIVRYCQLLKMRFSVKGNHIEWHKKINELCAEYKFGGTNNCSSLLCVEAFFKNKQEVFETKDFDTFVPALFENRQFYISTEYDSILKAIFGNYMTLPPKEKQIPHALLKCGFYWK